MEALTQRARTLGEPAWRIDRRQFLRWVNGEVVPKGMSDRRVIEAEFGVPVAVLLAPATGHPELCAPGAPDPAAVDGEPVPVPA